MEQERSDKIAYTLSALLHLGLLAVLWLATLSCERYNAVVEGLQLSELLGLECVKPISLAGPIIEATLVGQAAAPKARPQGKPQPPKPEPPKPEPPAEEPAKPAPPAPPPPDKKAQELEQKKEQEQKRQEQQHAQEVAELQRQDQVEREKVAALAQQKAAEEKRVQEERRRQEQVLLEEQKKQAEQKKQDEKLKQEQAKQLKQLEDLRRQREAAEKKSKLEAERLKQLQDKRVAQDKRAERQHMQDLLEAEKATTGMAGKDDSLSAKYQAALQSVVTQNWNRPDNAQSGLKCAIRIIQIPGGDVISANVVMPCNADQITRSSIEQAVMKAAPLPYQGYESVFTRDITFIFHYDG